MPFAFNLYLPSKSNAYFSSAEINGKSYLVEIDEEKKKIWVNSENNSLLKLAKYALIHHQKEALQFQLNQLDYEIYQMISNSISKSKALSRNIKSLGDLANIKIKLPCQLIIL